MTPDEYIMNIVRKYKLPDEIDAYTTSNIKAPLISIISRWASLYGYQVNAIKLSGSRSKGTAITLATDLDLFISISSASDATLKNIYSTLYTYISQSGISARRQNVSIGITYQGKKVDLVPARRQSQYGNDHSLYKYKQDSWTKTNIDTHISKVKNSARIAEIVATKVWRERHEIEFPSILLELIVIEALAYQNTNQPANNFMTVLRYLRDNIQSIRVVDPANTNNIISNDLTSSQKNKIRDQAISSLSELYWEQIIW